jgi:hypothetical protein
MIRLRRKMYTKNAPVSTIEDSYCARNRVGLVGVCLHANTTSMLVAEEVVDDLEPLLALRIIYARYILARLELALRVVAKEGKDRDNGRGRDVERELILEHRELLHEFRKALREVCAVVMQCRCRLCVLCLGRIGRGLLSKRRLRSWEPMGW